MCLLHLLTKSSRSEQIGQGPSLRREAKTQKGRNFVSRHHTLAEIKAALEAYHGCVYLAADSLGLWPSAIYARMKKSPQLRQLVDLYDGRRTDAAELRLEQAIRNGEAWAILFQLKTKGRSRGYVERQEVETHGRIQLEVEPRTGPELARAIQRQLDVLAAGGPTGLLAGDDKLPAGFHSVN